MTTDEAIEAFSNPDCPERYRRADAVERLAAALGISRQAIYMWGDEVPALRRYQIEELKGWDGE